MKAKKRKAVLRRTVKAVRAGNRAMNKAVGANSKPSKGGDLLEGLFLWFFELFLD